MLGSNPKREARRRTREVRHEGGERVLLSKLLPHCIRQLHPPHRCVQLVHLQAS